MSGSSKRTKKEWPSYIADRLGILPVQGSAGPWHSAGGTTDVAWFRAMCTALGIRYPGEKIRAMATMVEALGGNWDPSVHSSLGEGRLPGGNVTKEGFAYLSALLDDSLAAGTLLDRGSPPAVEEHEAERERVARMVLLRSGQARFRARLLAAYGGRCAVTSTDVVETLEAAHIQPHADRGPTSVRNGILLRADVHTLFDLRLVVVEPGPWRVLVHSRIRPSKLGKTLHGAPFLLTSSADDHPSTRHLLEHRRRAGF